MNKFIKILSFILLAIFLLIVPKLGTFIANLFDYSLIDPDNAFMWISIHHMVQALVVLIVIIIINKVFKIDFNLGFGNKKIGVTYLKRFMLYFSIYTLVAFLISFLLGNLQSFQYPLSPRNIGGYMSFQLFLSGPSEELIFRAFAITMFAILMTNRRIDKRLTYANLFAAIIFGIAHIQISFNPFSISYILPQVFLAIGLGYFYGDCYEKSKSVIYPMLMHSFSNVLMMGITIILSFI
jgi:membrane protease YdiL (CAAX protease family)